ncbi:MAG: hypothetical protein L3J92_04500 [Thermoplasmata archaeon]|jgi:hypothetical protein|nr:hypothetical protein [Thermoplasmata archaeon]
MALPKGPEAGRPSETAPAWSGSSATSGRIAPVATAERDLADGQYDRAVREAYHRVVLDLQKAYGLSLPAQWTHREFLSDFLRNDMGILTTLVAQLYRLYEPVRYGVRSDWLTEDPLPILHLIYNEPAMRDLYRVASPGPAAAPKGRSFASGRSPLGDRADGPSE